jgi:class II lanthipeptide synthase
VSTATSPAQQSIIENPAWRRAWFLNERLASLRHFRQSPKQSAPAFDRDLAAELLALWRSSAPLDRKSYFADRLAMDGIAEEEFVQILGTHAEAFSRDAEPPDWLATLARIYSQPQTAAAPHVASWGVASKLPAAGFLNLVTPLMSDARQQLLNKAEEIKRAYPAAPFETARAMDALFASLPARLLMLIAKTLVLELNVARLDGSLQGATPAERFASFAERLSSPEVALKVFIEYPVLARRIAVCLENWISSSAEFLQRLAVDWKGIASFFDIESECGQLVEAAAGAGDTHRHGRSVVIARFETGLQIVYKPRSLDVDEHFQQFIAWANDKGASPQLRTLKVLNRKTHGWVEFVHARPCQSEEKVLRFYERQGEYLAILYVLQATDFHFENLLACGEHPVLVDLEALFHPWMRELNLKQPDLRLVALAKGCSVLRAGLLPRRTGARGDFAGVELSGMGGAPGQATEDLLQWVSEGTDEMAALKQPFRMPGARNRPTLDGKDVDLRHYTEPIITGFTRMYELLCFHKRELLAEGGPLSRFAKDEVRVVARATRGYGMLLSQMAHPDYLRDALDLERLLDRLWAGVEDNPHLLPLLQAERSDLMRGDIPIFTAQPASRDIFTSNGTRVENFFPKEGVSLARECVERLRMADFRRQVWFIRASIATLDLQANDVERPGYEPVWPRHMLGHAELAPRLVEEARRIGDRLEELSVREGDNAAWIGFAHVNKTWSLDAVAEDLYAGAPGIILALAYLGAFSGRTRGNRGFDKYTGLARHALNTLRARLQITGKQVHSIGAFDGWGGIIYVLAHLSALWGDQELIAYASTVVERIPELVEQDESLDIIGGCAGCIGALLVLDRVSPSQKIVAVAAQCGDRLLARAQRVQNGIGWFSNVKTAKPITGFAHGAAGIAWALLELSARTGNQKYRETALEALAYEHAEYSSAAGNWAENAPGSGDTGPSMAWCYGAPGIGMSRSRALQHLADSGVSENLRHMVREDLERAIAATLERGPGSNHSLCHGDLGNLDFLLQAAEVSGDQQLTRKVNELTNQILASIEEYGWLSGVPLRVESPALMNGLAGVCYGLLRLAGPDRVPSVLTLAPPLSWSCV